ncbi:MAG: glucosaminidase domain-containing protein [Schleiferiaceae bacterium]|nr:glucosaminidase domain-containing protein [Schleiferiaceae bacterium]
MKKQFIVIFGFLSIQFAIAQNNTTYLTYIDYYKDLAISEMRDYGIPASIKLAQGILESAAGTSRLAVKANNHFGIKCHSGWEGKTVYHDDDKKNECFRKYKKVEDSYRDHSEFLRNRTRYAALFDLDPTDYRGWAHGLKKAGYATSPTYPEKLIKLIEDYNLHQYDLVGDLRPPKKTAASNADGEREVLMHANSLKYIIIQEGETLESIALEMKISVKRLLKFNEFRYDQVINPGDVIFLQSKRKSGPMDFYHVNNEGETMAEIAHKLGMRLESLYSKNRMDVGQQPKKGQQLWLKRTKR